MFRSVNAGVKSRPLLVVLAAVFAGLAMLLVAGAAVSGQALVLLAAVPLAMTAGLMWVQGIGRLTTGLFGPGSNNRRRARRYRRRVSDPRTTDGGASGSPDGARAGVGDRVAAGQRAATAGGGRGGDPGERSFDEAARRARRARARRQARRDARAREGDARGGESDASTSRGGWDARRTGRGRSARTGGMTAAEAYDVLGIDPPATDEEIRDTYRERAKTLHPDTDGGSTEQFQELNDAYESLVDG